MQSRQTMKPIKLWSGEPLWKGRPGTGRTVRITVHGTQFTAVGTVSRMRVFQVSGRIGDLQRFYRRMLVDGAELKGLKAHSPSGGHALDGSGQSSADRVTASGQADLNEIPPDDPGQPHAQQRSATVGKAKIHRRQRTGDTSGRGATRGQKRRGSRRAAS
jgi:hypothetical protein